MNNFQIPVGSWKRFWHSADIASNETSRGDETFLRVSAVFLIAKASRVSSILQMFLKLTTLVAISLLALGVTSCCCM